MPVSLSTALAISTLSLPIKNIYESGKEKFQEQLSKWGNAKNTALLASKISAYEKVKTIWQRDKFVKLSSFYYPAKITFPTKITKQVQSLKELSSFGGIVLQGTVGQGKSVLLRHLCIQELGKNSSGRIPIFVELKKLDKNLSVEGAVFETLKSLGFEISETLFEYYAESGKLVLLLDGFDEVESSSVPTVISKLEFWAHRFPELQVIVTCRPGGEIQKSAHFTTIPLAHISTSDYRPFLKKMGKKDELITELLTAIESSPVEIKGLLNTPLLLTLLVVVYQSERVIPNELSEFFKMLFNTVFTKHDRTKPGFNREHKSGLNERRLESLFEAFCFAVLKNNLTVNLKLEQFHKAFDDASKFSAEKCDVEGFQHDIVKVACLMQEDGFYISFLHKSLLDYFSAAFIKNCTEEQSKKIYESIKKNWHKRRPSLHFLSQIDKYRFAKYFAIPHLQEILSSMKSNDGSIPEEHVFDVLESVYEHTKIRCGRSGSGSGLEVKEAGPYRFYTTFFSNHVEFPKNWVNNGMKSITGGATHHELDETGSVNFTWNDIKDCQEFLLEASKLIRNTADEAYRTMQTFQSDVNAEDEKGELLADFDFN